MAFRVRTPFWWVKQNMDIKAKNPGLVKRAANGSRQAAIRLHCLDCTCDQPKLIRTCPIKDCALYSYRMGRKLKPGEM